MNGDAVERRAAAGAVVVRDDGCVLVIRRGRAPGAGEWTLPGGNVEPGETAAGAVMREVHEETGLGVRVVGTLGCVALDGEGYSYVIAEHLCVPEDDAPLRPGDDAAEARWVTPSELVGLGVSKAARAVVAGGLAALGSLAPSPPPVSSGTGEVTVLASAPMRTTHTCPKCKNQEVLFFPQIADRDDDDNVKPLSTHVVHFDWKDDMEVGKLQAYICRKCGFTELYTNEVPSIPWEKVPGARLLTPKDPPLPLSQREK